MQYTVNSAGRKRSPSRRVVVDLCRIISIVLNSFEAKAASPGSIMKLFQGFKKLFTKGVDEIPELGKKMEDLKAGKNPEEFVIPSSNLDDAKNFSDKVLSETKELDNLDLLDAHNVKRSKEKNIDQLFDAVDSLSGDSLNSAIIIPFLQTEWHGKVFRSSKISRDALVKSGKSRSSK